MKLQKKLFSFLITLALAYPVFGQMSSSATIVIIDALGNKDSVMIGNPSNSTLGVDPEWEEENLFGQPWGNPEIRSVIRPTMCSNQTWEMDLDYEGLTLDLKKDFREGLTYSYSPASNYTFAINATNYPVEVIFKGDIENGVCGVCLLYDSLQCAFEATQVTDHVSENSTVVIDTIREETSSKWLRIVFTILDGTPQINVLEGVFPNPSGKSTTVRLGQSVFGSIKLISATGSVMRTIDVKGQSEVEVDVSGIPNGFYTLLVWDKYKHALGWIKLVVRN